MDDAKKAKYNQMLFNKTNDEECVNVFNLTHDLTVALGKVDPKHFAHMFNSTVGLLVSEFVNSDKYEDFLDSIHLDLVKFETEQNIQKAERLMHKSDSHNSKRKRRH